MSRRRHCHGKDSPPPPSTDIDGFQRSLCSGRQHSRGHRRRHCHHHCICCSHCRHPRPLSRYHRRCRCRRCRRHRHRHCCRHHALTLASAVTIAAASVNVTAPPTLLSMVGCCVICCSLPAALSAVKICQPPLVVRSSTLTMTAIAAVDDCHRHCHSQRQRPPKASGCRLSLTAATTIILDCSGGRWRWR